MIQAARITHEEVDVDKQKTPSGRRRSPRKTALSPCSIIYLLCQNLIFVTYRFGTTSKLSHSPSANYSKLEPNQFNNLI